MSMTQAKMKNINNGVIIINDRESNISEGNG